MIRIAGVLMHLSLAFLGVLLVVLPATDIYSPDRRIVGAGANYLNLLSVYLILQAVKLVKVRARRQREFEQEARAVWAIRAEVPSNAVHRD